MPLGRWCGPRWLWRCSSRLLWWVDDDRRSASYGYTFGPMGLGVLVLPTVLPVSISQVNGAKLWVRLGRLSIQPGVCKNFDHRVRRGVPGRQPGVVHLRGPPFPRDDPSPTT